MSKQEAEVKEISLKDYFVPLTTAKAIHFIVIIGLVIYGSSLFNGFLGDDPGYMHHPYIQQFQLLKLIGGGSTDLGGTSPATSQFYRPMMLISFAQIYHFFGDSAFFYHVLQLILHIANSLLLFLFFKKFFRQSLALIASLIFLVHPINVEAVAYISDLQDVLFVFFGLIALTLLSKKGELSVTRQCLLGVFILLSFLSKETGIVFVFIIFLYQFFFKAKQKLKVLTPIFGAVFIYGVLRFAIASVWIGKSPTSPLSELSLSDRLINIPKIFTYYIGNFFYPTNLALGQAWFVHEITLETFFIPLFVTMVFLTILVGGGIWVYKQNRKQLHVFIFFFVWFITGMAIHLQIIPLEMTVATRWFYFPIIGLLGMISVVPHSFWQHKKLKTSFVCIFIVVLIVFAFQTCNRLRYWKDATTLYTHDISQTQSYLLEHSLGYELLQQGKLTEAHQHLKASIDLFANPINTNSMGVYYYQMKNISEAKKWFYRSNSLGDYYLAYQNQARLLLSNDKVQIAQQYIEKAHQKFPQSDVFLYLLAIAKYKKGDTAGALDAAEKAYAISPSKQNTYVLSQLQRQLPIKITY